MMPQSATGASRPKVTNLQVVLSLVDENMVADPSWRHWLSDLRPRDQQNFRREIFPVALDATAYNLPGSLRDLNFLRPSGLPLVSSEPAIKAYEKRRLATPEDSVRLPSDEQKLADTVEIVIRSLLKQLTEALCRLLLTQPRNESTGASAQNSGGVLPKVTIFLSHAKIDGTIPARRLRDHIYSQTQLAAFYDENDIAFGSIFSRVLENDLNSPVTSALIAVRSAKYARRPWCRRELSLFRKPRQEVLPAGSVGERWRLHPVLIVEAMEGAEDSFCVPEFGNAPVIRWSAKTVDIEEQIVTTVIRDAMLASFHSAMAAAIPLQPNRIVINWLPDPTTLLCLPAVRSGLELDVIHPGQGLSGLELDVLSEFFPNLTFLSFEEILT